MEFRYQRRVFGYECDVYGHLNNANYLHLFEEARASVLLELGLPVSELLRLNIQLFVTAVEIRFQKSVPAESMVTVTTRVPVLTRLKGVWEQEIRNEQGEICTTATVHGVFAREGRPYRIDESLLARLKGESPGEDGA